MLGPPLARGRYKSCRAVFKKAREYLEKLSRFICSLCGTELYTAQLTGFQLIALRTEKPSDTLHSFAAVRHHQSTVRAFPATFCGAPPKRQTHARGPPLLLPPPAPPGGHPEPRSRLWRRGRQWAGGDPGGRGLTRSLGLAPSPRTARLRAAGSGQRV